MNLEFFLDTYPEIAGFCFAGGFVLAAMFGLVNRLLDVICDQLFFRHQVNRCKGFMSGQIQGACHCRKCVYSLQCTYYAPRKKLFQRLKEKKNKPHS